MAESRCFQTQLNSIMEIMSRALVRQICKIVDSDLACLRLELERALRDNAALGDKMRVLEGEVETLRNAGARSPRKSYRSVYVQTSEAPDAPPSINGIFGKEWCSNLWEGRPRTREEAVEVEPDISDEPENDDDGNVHEIKEEISEREICVVSPTSGSRRNTSSASPDPKDDSVNAADDDIRLISGLPETSDVDAAAPDSPGGTSATKLISEDGTVQHVIVSGDDSEEEDTRLEFEQHCMPIEFADGPPGEAAAFQRRDTAEPDASEFMSGGKGGGEEGSEGGGGGGDKHILNYFNRFNILQHRRPGDDSGKTDFTCRQCGKVFLRRNGLMLHMKSHQKQNAHTCHSCKASFPQKNLLRTHKCLPSGKKSGRTAEMRFRCEVCGKYFHSKANLKVHYAVHTGERPHTCGFCGKGFSQKGNLTTHERIHKGERPYVCSTCGKGFTQKGNLTHHLAIHSKMSGRKAKAAEKWQ